MKRFLTFGFCAWSAGSVCAQMTLPGSFGVSPSGAATYDIPIQVAPGVAGIEPKLSLSFNSQSGNGLLGLNWNLSGLSAITRCPQTKAQDGASAVLGINYASSDRFCLDGQRLMVIAGTHGATGSEYRTEIEAYSKVVAEAVSGVASAPAKFTVKTQAGLTMEYG